MIANFFYRYFLLFFLLPFALFIPPQLKGYDLINQEEHFLKLKKEGWELIEKKEEVYLLRKKTSDGGTFFRSFGLIKTPILKVLFLLRDLDHAPNWMPNLAKKTLVQEMTPVNVITHDVYHMPWPTSDRETHLHSVLTLNKEQKQFEVESSSVSNSSPSHSPKEKTSFVEASVNSSSFIFKPLSPNETFIDISANIDLKGTIPSFLAHFVQKEWPFHFIKSLEEKAIQMNSPRVPLLEKMVDEFKKL